MLVKTLMSMTTLAACTVGMLASSPALAGSENEAAAEARQVMERVMKRYRDAPTLSDSVRIAADGDEMMLRMRFDKKNERISLDVPGWQVYQIESSVYVLTDAVPEKYLEKELGDSLHSTLIELFGMDPNLPFQFAARQGGELDAVINALGLNILQMPRLTGMTETQHEDRTYHRLKLEGLGGEMTVDVDRDHVVHRARIELESPVGDDKIIATLDYDPVFAETLDEAVSFDPSGREKVASAEELAPPAPQMVEAGSPAPDFSFQTLDGETISLEDLRGSVVVLDFWATWCGPCIQAMPMVDALAKWAEENDQPVKVYAVNIWESERDFDRRKEQIKNFWSQRDYERLKTLLDPEDAGAEAYGLSSIPATIVIRPDGVIHKVHIGYTPRLKELLEEAAKEAMDAAG
ncbi:MAG: TlpA family protein disulfide reductase [Phycisphaerales bacterium]|nr:MAG: TlpA family protein disulfide reductase [Phycisphaerales bacterium]